MHELDADRAAVGFTQNRDQLFERGVARVAQLVVENTLQVGLGQAERRRLEQLERVVPGLQLQGVEIGQVVAELAIGVDQARDGRLGASGVEIEVIAGRCLGLAS